MTKHQAERRSFIHLVRLWFDSDALDTPPSDETANQIDWFRCLPYFIIHLGCLGVIWVGFSWFALSVAVFLYLVRMFSITGFYHRYFSHRTFKTSRALQFIGALIAGTAGQRGPLWWTAHHRHHHAVADRPEDPHSPRQRGFLWSHTGWFMTKANFVTRQRYVRDWIGYPELRFLNRFDWIPPLGLALILFSLGFVLGRVFPSLNTSGMQLLIWGFFISTVALLHATFAVNSFAHLFGRRRFETKDNSRNSFLLAMLTLGEGWHNNHHHYPGAIQQGFFRGEIDITYYILLLLSKLGLVWDLRLVPEKVLVRSRYDLKGKSVPHRDRG